MGVTGRQDEPSCPFGESKNLMEGKRKTAICIKQEARYLLRSRRTGTYMARMEGLAEVLRSACSSLDKENSVIPPWRNYTIYAGRNRRATATLSPVLIHFLSSSSFLSQKLQLALTQLRANGTILLPPATKRRPGPAKPKHGIPPTEWPTVQRRVLENQEPLRKVADDYGVSYETVRRTVLAARKAKRA